MQAIFEVIAQVLFEVICGITGHIILWAITFGHWKPFQDDEYNIAIIVGILFWIAVGVGIWFFFFR